MECPQRPKSTSKEDRLYSCFPEEEEEDGKQLTSRMHTQVIHKYTGWSLRHFKDLQELLGVISDIVKGK